MTGNPPDPREELGEDQGGCDMRVGTGLSQSDCGQLAAGVQSTDPLDHP